MKKNPSRKMLAVNRSARHDYFIEETIEAGLVLTGTEIKSLRQGKVSLAESYARVIGGELFILGMNIKPYDYGNRFNVDPLRPRKLLVHKKEIRKLIAEVKREGLTIVPLRIYLNDRGLAKMEIAVARGKKLYDKRDTLAKRDAERRIQRTKLK
ncbi:MAG: SsrA-binding protein SmpB [Clostridiales Family XIII bacterium]|jgi:SsrA-binding protein|nr:SsrA-binding protein SmpB [Clostridiales Family XIII bacterium]